MTDPRPLRVAIVVLSEIAQSRPMQLYARALAEQGTLVDVIAYVGRLKPDWLKSHGSISLWPLRPPGVNTKRLGTRRSVVTLADFRWQTVPPHLVQRHGPLYREGCADE